MYPTGSSQEPARKPPWTDLFQWVGQLPCKSRMRRGEAMSIQNCTNNTDTSSVDFFFFARRRS